MLTVCASHGYALIGVLFSLDLSSLFECPVIHFVCQNLREPVFSDAVGDTAYSQELLKTIVYAKCGGQTKYQELKGKYGREKVSRNRKFFTCIVILDHSFVLNVFK